MVAKPGERIEFTFLWKPKELIFKNAHLQAKDWTLHLIDIFI
jgi:hypothetical protein